MESHQNETDTIEAVSDYLSLLQLKYDCATVYSLVSALRKDGIANLGTIPHFSLTAASALELINPDDSDEFSKSDFLQIQDVRLKLKVFEDGYSKSKRMILNIDYLQDQIYKNMLKFSFMQDWNIHYNLGIYTDDKKRVVGNTQYAAYILQDSRFLKKSIDEVAKAFQTSPKRFSMLEQSKKNASEYGYKLGQVIGSVHGGLSRFDMPLSIDIKPNTRNYCYADYNTNVNSSLFPTGQEGKAMILYLLHILTTINFLLYVLNDYEKDDYGWWLKTNYIAYYYSIKKLQSLQQYLIQNKQLTLAISDYFAEMELDDTKYMNATFRNCVMHSRLTDKNGYFLINTQLLDKNKPLFGLVETCFDGISYNIFKESIISKTTKISDVLSDWLAIQNLNITPLDKEI